MKWWTQARTYERQNNPVDDTAYTKTRNPFYWIWFWSFFFTLLPGAGGVAEDDIVQN